MTPEQAAYKLIQNAAKRMREEAESCREIAVDCDEEIDPGKSQDSKPWQLIRARVADDCADEIAACRTASDLDLLVGRWQDQFARHHAGGNCPIEFAVRNAACYARHASQLLRGIS